MTLIIPIKKRDGDAEFIKSVEDVRNKIDDVVRVPSELLKAREHLGRARGTGNAKGTVGPKEPSGGKASKPRKVPVPENSKVGSDHKEISKRGGHKPPSSSYATKVSGSESSASNNLILRNTDTGKKRTISIGAGTANRASFNHAGNLIKLTIDGKSYPCANHLVTLPTGVYRYAGLSTSDQGSSKVARSSGKPGA